MTRSMCGPGARWCARADAIFDVPDMHVLDVGDDPDGQLILTAESDEVQTGCPSCGESRLATAADSACCMMRRT
jgi:transposase